MRPSSLAVRSARRAAAASTSGTAPTYTLGRHGIMTVALSKSPSQRKTGHSSWPRMPPKKPGEASSMSRQGGKAHCRWSDAESPVDRAVSPNARAVGASCKAASPVPRAMASRSRGRTANPWRCQASATPSAQATTVHCGSPARCMTATATAPTASRPGPARPSWSRAATSQGAVAPAHR